MGKYDIKNIEDKKEDYNFDRATPEQLAKLDQLYKEIINTYRFLNHPFSTILSVLIFPSLLERFFLTNNAWSLPIIEKFFISLQQLSSDYIDSSFQERSVQANKIADEVKNIIKAVKTIFRSHCDSASQKKISMDACYDLLDNIGNPKDFLQIKTNTIQSMSTVVKSVHPFLIKIYQMSYLVEKIQQLDPTTTSLKEMMQTYDTVIKKVLEPLLSPPIAWIKLVVNVYLTSLIFSLTKIGISTAGQMFLLDPLLLWLRPGRLMLAHKPLTPYLQLKKNAQDAAEEIKQQSQRLVKLKQGAAFNKSIARYLLLFAVIYTIYAIYNLIFNPLTSTTRTTYFTIGAISTALKDGYQDWHAWRKVRNRNQYLSSSRLALDKVTQCLGKVWELVGSYFQVSLERQNHLSGKAIARVLEYYLQKNGIETYHSNNHRVFVSADQPLGVENLKCASKNFSLAIARLHNIRKLKMQILEIVKMVSTTKSLLELPFQDRADLPSACFQLPALAWKSTDFTLFFKILETNNIVSTDTSPATITGHIPVKSKQIDQVKASLNEYKFVPSHINQNNDTTSAFSSWEKTYSGRRVKNVGKNTKKNDPEIKAEVKSSATSIKDEKIWWGQYSYDPSDLECPIQPMRPAELSQGRHYVMCELEEKHMPAGYPANFRDRLERVALSTPISSNKQCWIFTTATQCTNLITGKKEQVSAKLRLYGMFNDGRGFAVATKNESGQILHRLVGFEPHGH
ncbi:MAG: hypothetical protein JSR33_13685 [Proteobacteria bacterium]|nr:hypothetical protein [Pseudomonadota bacterium]